MNDYELPNQELIRIENPKAIDPIVLDRFRRVVEEVSLILTDDKWKKLPPRGRRKDEPITSAGPVLVRSRGKGKKIPGETGEIEFMGKRGEREFGDGLNAPDSISSGTWSNTIPDAIEESEDFCEVRPISIMAKFALEDFFNFISVSGDLIELPQIRDQAKIKRWKAEVRASLIKSIQPEGLPYELGRICSAENLESRLVTSPTGLKLLCSYSQEGGFTQNPLEYYYIQLGFSG